MTKIDQLFGIDSSMKRLLAASALFLFPFCADAQALMGPYVSLGLGANLPSNETLESTYNPGFPSIDYNVDNGLGLNGSLGWGFENGFRAEVEGDFANNHLSSGHYHDFPSAGDATPGGTQRQYGVMVNVLYDFNLGLPVTPYIGAGIGYQAVDWSGTFNCNNDASKSCTATTGGLGYQAIAGLSYPLDFLAPGLALTAEYRYLGVSNLGDSFDVGTSDAWAAYNAGTGPKPSATISDIHNNQALIGLRYSFGELLE